MLKDPGESWRLESEIEIKAFLQDLNYALDHGARITFQEERRVDLNRSEKYTNKYTVATLFPNEDPVSALKRELKKLTVEDYIRTVKDVRFPHRSEMREFGKTYNSEDVYIKLRVEVLNCVGETVTFVMSFHFAEKSIESEDYPYKRR